MRAGAAHPTTRELHLESVLGAVVHDRLGQKVGRLEEVIAERQGTELVVVEYHLGPAAVLERIMDFAGELPLLSALRHFVGERYRVRWHEMDLSDPGRPRLTITKAEVARSGARSVPRLD